MSRLLAASEDEVESLLERIGEVLLAAPAQDSVTLYARVPHSYQTHTSVLRFLTPKGQFQVLAGRWPPASLAEQRKTVDRMRELYASFPPNDRRALSSRLPSATLRDPTIYELLPFETRLSVLQDWWSETTARGNLTLVTWTVSLICGLTQTERVASIFSLPPWLARNERVLSLCSDLQPTIQFRFMHHIYEVDTQERQSLLPELWPYLKEDAKLLVIFWLAKEHHDIRLLDGIQEEDFRVRAALTIITALKAPSLSDALFQHSHNLLQDYAIYQAMVTTDEVSLLALLPICRPGKVAWCEGRRWKKSGLDTVFCPRANQQCIPIGPDMTYAATLAGARIAANLELPIENWSLLELLAAAHIEPRLPDLRVAGDYVPKLAGWVNRLNEIRDRLRCRICHGMMTPNRAYAKHLARYNMTIASCPSGDGHDQNVYLNHCWACREVIDSRDCLVQVEERYLCLKCGSGPQQSDWFTQGDRCPRCNAASMAFVRGSTGRRCGQCGHRIKLLPEWKLTGPRQNGSHLYEGDRFE